MCKKNLLEDIIKIIKFFRKVAKLTKIYGRNQNVCGITEIDEADDYFCIYTYILDQTQSFLLRIHTEYEIENQFSEEIKIGSAHKYSFISYYFSVIAYTYVMRKLYCA